MNIFSSLVSADLRAWLNFLDLPPYFVGGSKLPGSWLPDFVPDTYEVATALESEIILN